VLPDLLRDGDLAVRPRLATSVRHETVAGTAGTGSDDLVHIHKESVRQLQPADAHVARNCSICAG
jgi:hypothetical protein